MRNKKKKIHKIDLLNNKIKFLLRTIENNLSPVKDNCVTNEDEEKVIYLIVTTKINFIIHITC